MLRSFRTGYFARSVLSSCRRRCLWSAPDRRSRAPSGPPSGTKSTPPAQAVRVVRRSDENGGRTDLRRCLTPEPSFRKGRTAVEDPAAGFARASRRCEDYSSLRFGRGRPSRVDLPSQATLVFQRAIAGGSVEPLHTGADEAHTRPGGQRIRHLSYSTGAGFEGTLGEHHPRRSGIPLVGGRHRLVIPTDARHYWKCFAGGLRL